MKIRLGFVSNSSSSSFVAIVEKKYFDEYIKSAHPYMKHLLKIIIKSKPITLAGVEFMKCVSHESTEEAYWVEGYSGELLNREEKVIGTIDEDDDYYENEICNSAMSREEAYYKIVSKVKAMGGDAFFESIDC